MYVAAFDDQQPYLAMWVGLMASHTHRFFSMSADRNVRSSLQGPATLSGHVGRVHGPPEDGCGGVGLSDSFHVAHGALRKAEQCDLQPCSAACHQCSCGCYICKLPPPPLAPLSRGFDPSPPLPFVICSHVVLPAINVVVGVLYESCAPPPPAHPPFPWF